MDVIRIAPQAAVGRKKARYPISDLLGVSDPEAEQFARDKVANLTSNDYCETVELAFAEGPVIADVYGVTDVHCGWYIKFHVSQSQMQICSCHQAEFDMNCAGHTVKGKK